MNDGRAVANAILDIAESEHIDVTNLALQKIMYFCHGWFLAAHGAPLIKQEFEAWQYGPVLQHVYREFKDNDRAPISSRAMRVELDTGLRIVVPPASRDDEVEIIAACTRFYGRLRAGTLVEMTHVPGSPWDLAWNHKGTVNPGMRLPNSLIENFFRGTARPF